MVDRNSFRFILCAAVILLSGSILPARTVELGPGGKATALVADPAASGGQSVALRIADAGSSQGQWTLTSEPARPGFYQLEAALRFRLPAEFDHARLGLRLAVRSGGAVLTERTVSVLGLNPGGYARVPLSFSLNSPGSLELVASLEIAETAAGKPKKLIQPFKAPVAGTLEQSVGDAPAIKGAGLDDLMADMASEKAVALESIDYPVLLLDLAELTSVSGSLAIERVRPAKVHVYPGESNPVAVVVRNYTPVPAKGVVRLTMKTGLDEAAPAVEQIATVPGNGTTEARFDWVSGAREFGHEAFAEILVDGKPVHAASEHFSVSAPLWKTAIQGPGFLTWFGREKEFPGHVAANRRAYVNVEEAFSWQPSSWTDLNPTNSHWWSGQNNFHNSLSGLRQWMDLSHAEGIKLITYMWATASGPQGVEWARRHPELVSRGAIGLGSEFHDVEDLRLYDLTHEEPALEDYQYGVWHSFGINRGYLRLIEMGADQLIRSARNFGWDGVRFDSQLTWGAMPAAAVKAELGEMGAADLMLKLAPELMARTGAVWNATAVSVRNVRYMKHRLREGAGPRYEIASNYGPVKEEEPKKEGTEELSYFDNYCAGGSQVNQEYFRQMRNWKPFYDGLLEQVDLTRRAGGFHAVQSLDAVANAETKAYNNIFIFACGSHPYIYGEGRGSPGRYARFMTRYGEYLWDPALAPVTAEEAGLSVKSEASLLWKPFVKRRALADGTVQTVVQLIAPPGSDELEPARPAPLAAWAKQVRVSKAGGREPVAWLLTAEPDCRAERLPVEKEAGGHAVVVPELRLWSLVVWQDREETP